MDLPINQIICGTALEVLKPMPDGTDRSGFSCSISSPPYWGLRDYGTATWEGGDVECSHILENTERGDGDRKSCQPKGKYLTKDICKRCGAKRIDQQLGLEKTFEEYIDKLCTIYDEVKRVLRKDGTCFVNLGDTYNSGGNNRTDSAKDKTNTFLQMGGNLPDMGRVKVDTKLQGISAKSLCLIPQRFAIEMVNRGWILRNTIIWKKPNPMPSSAKGRFTVDFEYVYFFVRSRKYFFEPQYEPYSPNSDMEYRKTLRLGKFYRAGNQNPYKDNTPLAGDRKMTPLAEGRNKRCVWTIPTQPFPEAHFATYPEKLVEPMIKAGCPEFICEKCGVAREKVYAIERIQTRPIPKTKRQDELGKCASDPGRHCTNRNHTGYTDCGCNAEWKPGVVLDPFTGSGTTLQVAARLNRNYLGIELKPEYIEMAEKRVMQGESGIPVKEQKKGQGALFPK